MAYELTLAQSMAAIHGDTITSSSLVIGFYVLSLGLGAAFWARSVRPKTLSALWTVELILAIVGPLAPVLIFQWHLWSALVMALVVGFFAGMEIPLLIALAGDGEGTDFRATRLVIGLDFIGTFVASVIVPLWLFEAIGLVGVAAVGGLVNAGLAAALVIRVRGVARAGRLAASAVAGCLLIFALTRLPDIEAFLSRSAF
jgi:spermidine synthase